jgi:hypothetical protein
VQTGGLTEARIAVHRPHAAHTRRIYIRGRRMAMGFVSEFHSVCKFKDENELYQLLEYGKTAMVKSGFRIYPTGQLAVAYRPDNKAVAIVKITASIAEINFQGEEVTKVEMDLVRRLTDEESRVLTALGAEMYFGGK